METPKLPLQNLCVDALTLFNVEQLLCKITLVARAIKIISTYMFPMHPFYTP